MIQDTSRTDHLEAGFARFLARRSTPMDLEGAENAQAQADEVLALRRLILETAPPVGYEAWLDAVVAAVARSMRTRAWPNEGQLAAAIESVQDGRRADGLTAAPTPDQSHRTSNRMVDLLADYYGRHQREAPGLGSADRTRALISRGILLNAREARFRGFTLDEDLLEQARSQEMGAAEWEHHVTVMARLRGQDYATADAACRMELGGERPPMPRGAIKRMPETPRAPAGGSVWDDLDEPAPTHWSQRADPAGPEMAALRAARERAGMIVPTSQPQEAPHDDRQP